VVLAFRGGGVVTGSTYAHRKLFGHLAKAISGRALVKDAEAMRRLADDPSETDQVVTRSTTRERERQCAN